MLPEAGSGAPASSMPSSHEQGRLQSFVTTLLRHEGALVEAIEPEGLEVLAPSPVQRALGIGELARLGFGTTLPASAQRVGLEGDWLDRFTRLLGSQGHLARRVVSSAAKVPGDPERVLAHALVLDNATYRLLEVVPAWTRYLLLDFRASAVSDDKRDWMVRLGVNLATGALPDAVLAAIAPDIDAPPFASLLPDGSWASLALPADAELPAIWDRPRVLSLVERALPPRLDAVLGPFVKGLRRRLVRDEDRLHLYHNDLYREAMRRAVALPDGDPRRRREEQRAEAIGLDYRAKLDDLARQYATQVTVAWVQTLELAMPVYRFAVQLRRRKADRVIRLDWNPLARALEPPACEFTASTERPRLVCDDALHLIVPAALSPCPACGRQFCRACHRERCPKCGAAVQMRAKAPSAPRS
jgi:hypothetical protein